MGLIFKYYVFIGLGRRTKADIWVIKLQTPGWEQLEGQERFFPCKWAKDCDFIWNAQGQERVPQNPAQPRAHLHRESQPGRAEPCLTTLCSKVSFPSQSVSVCWLTSLFSPFSSLKPFWFGLGWITSSVHHQPAGIKPLLKCWILLKSLSTRTLVWIRIINIAFFLFQFGLLRE